MMTFFKHVQSTKQFKQAASQIAQHKIAKALLIIGAMLATATSHADQATFEKNLSLIQKDVPTFKAKVLGETPIKGIYAFALGDNIYYSDESAQYFIMGDLYDFKTKKNLTLEQQSKLNQIDVKQLPLNQAIKTVKGNGKRTLYVFSDPDCPYCKKLEQNLKNIDNITIYTFLYPLKSLHPNAETRAKQIWCAKNQTQAWQSYMTSDILLDKQTNCANPIEQNIKLGLQLNISGTPTLFLKDGSRLAGLPSDIKKLDSMID